ncbi:small terminase subunit [Shewanella halifaxensis HAW-EB4]|uniref:Small terminase subunit n=1 Tax=Shewanella halifaxensis (strain HAW-EB4) TaxID=458817 RepID=B0TKU0_SHEHH|nr:phage terminase small subunit [Shewanella halifaxensis]ABZ75892.1 small terminase subunit [Shewanella halifaxensis HAW-EB4]
MQLIELEDDLKRLKGLVRRADKVAHKRDVLLPKWLPIVTEYLETVATLQSVKENDKNAISDNPIFAYCVVWLFDVDDLGQGIELGLKAIELNQPMVRTIRRQWAGFISDAVFDWCEIQADNGHSIEPYFSQVFKHVANSWKLPEVVTAKYYKFAGLALLRTTNGEVKPTQVGDIDRLQQADALLEKAASLHKHAQVKTIRNKIEMRIRALEAYGSQESGSQEPS